MALPEGIPTVTVTGRYLTPGGSPLTGAVVWRTAPGVVTFGDADVILGGPERAELDATGAFTVTLPATDAEGMNPSGWAYEVVEQIPGTMQRSYLILLPQAYPVVDIADLAPTDPSTPDYIAVRGDSAYEVAVDQGFTGTEAEWLASLVGPTGPAGPPGEPGEPGPAGPPGVIQSVNGQSAVNVVLDATDVGAASTDHTHPDAGAVDSVNGQTGVVVLDAADVGAIPSTQKGAPSGVATLGADGLVSSSQLPASTDAVTSVNSQTGAVVLDAADVQAVGLTGDQVVAGGKTFTGLVQMQDAAATALQLTAADPVLASHATRKDYVDSQVAASAARAAQNTWTPQSLGFQAWSFDPGTVNYRDTSPPAAQYPVGRTMFSGMNITENTDVNHVVIFARGWAGSELAPDERFFAGIYDESGNRVATSGEIVSLPGAGQIPGSSAQASGNHVGAVPVPLSGTVTLTPGRYWAAFLHSSGFQYNFYYLPVENWSPTPPVNFFLGASAFQRFWFLDSQVAMPTSVDPASGSTQVGDTDLEDGAGVPIMALALI